VCDVNQGREIWECGNEAMRWDSILIYQDTTAPMNVEELRLPQYSGSTNAIWPVSGYLHAICYTPEILWGIVIIKTYGLSHSQLYVKMKIRRNIVIIIEDLNTGGFSSSIDCVYDWLILSSYKYLCLGMAICITIRTVPMVY